jgi:hypothetical protein
VRCYLLVMQFVPLLVSKLLSGRLGGWQFVLELNCSVVHDNRCKRAKHLDCSACPLIRLILCKTKHRSNKNRTAYDTVGALP